MSKNTQQASLWSYVTGFVLSLYLTTSAYLLVVHHTLARRNLLAAITGLALAQFAVQLLFFLHLGQESRPRWRLVVFSFMVLVVAILVFGSLWIMSNLNYHMTSPTAINKYIHNQDGL